MKNLQSRLHATRNTVLALCVLLNGVFWPLGCATSHSNPLAGWKMDFAPHLEPAIATDCQDYIKNLPPSERNSTALGGYFEDGTGRHAVTIGVSRRNGTDWTHVLIYDRENKRIKVIKFVSGHHRS